MKKLYLLLGLALCAIGVHAQSGLFNLAYAMPFVQADSLLVMQGFRYDGKVQDMVRYLPNDKSYVTALIVFVEPVSERMVGWFIKYNAENSEGNDEYVVKTLQEMHGEKNHYDEETQQLIWYLSTTRTVHLMYAEENALTVLYYDSYFPKLFKIHPDEPQPPDTPLEPDLPAEE